MSDSTSRVRIDVTSSGDFTAFETGAVKVDQLAQSIKTAQSALGALGFGVSAAAVIRFGESILSAAAEITNLSNRIGISVEAFQVLNNLARQTGLGVGEMQTALSKLHETIDTTATNGGKAEKAFEKLGLNAKVLAGVPLERALEAIAYQVVQAKNQTEAYSLAAEILGTKNLPKLHEMVVLLSGGLDKMAKSQKDAGLIMDEQNVKRLTSVWENFGNAFHHIGVELGNVLGNMTRMAAGEWMPQGVRNFFEALNPVQEGAQLVRPEGRGASLASARKNMGTTYVADDTSAAGIASLSGHFNRDQAETKAKLELQKEIAGVMTGQTTEAQRQADIYLRTKEKIEELADPLKKYRDEIESFQHAFALGGISEEELNRAVAQVRENARKAAIHHREDPVVIRETQFERSKSDYEDGKSDNPRINPYAMTPSQGAQVALMDYVTRIGSIGNQINATFTNIAQSLSGGIANGISGLILRTQTWGQALKGIWNGFVTSMVNAFSQMLAEWAVKKAAMFVLDQLYAAAGLALSGEAAGESLLMWLPSAIAASISSYGIAAAVGAAAVVGIIAATKGFEGGGYTGGMEGQPAGQVHGQEFVFSAPAVRNIGLENLQAMHSSRALIPAPSGASGGSQSLNLSVPKEQRVILVDHRETDRIAELMADPRFDNRIQRVSRRDRGV